MLPTRRVTVWLTLIAMLGSIVITPHSQAGKRWYQSTTTVDKLARSIDKLQKHLDEYGTVVAKSPDVWGESRLMRHRDDFEKQFTVDNNKFNQVLSAAQSTRDGAFLASALSLQNALAGQNAPANGVSNLLPDVANAAAAQPDTVFQFNNSGVTSAFTTTELKEGEAATTLAIGTEPEIYLDQKKRFYDHLNQIRRLNEGDDTADSPGYALNLVRIPVSLLPGRKTRTGHGAEVNVTIEPVLGEDLLPETFRDFVINDIVNRVAPRVTNFVNQKEDKQKELKDNWDKYSNAIIELQYIDSVQFTDWPLGLQTKFEEYAREELAQLKLKNASVMTNRSSILLVQSSSKKLNSLGEVEEQFLENFISEIDKNNNGLPTNFNLDNLIPRKEDVEEELIDSMQPKSSRTVIDSDGNRRTIDVTPLNMSENPFQTFSTEIRSKMFRKFEKNNSDLDLNSFTQNVLAELRKNRESISVSSSLVISSRRPDVSIPDSQQYAVNGSSLAPVYIEAARVFSSKGINKSPVHLSQVKAYLRDELHASYQLLSQQNAVSLWETNCTPHLAQAVREHRRRFESKDWEQYVHLNPEVYLDNKDFSLSGLRGAYHKSLAKLFPRADFGITANLGWHIMVESALLNERLIEDMKILASSKNAYHLCTDWQAYYGPNPCPEARAAFNDYVRTRWPIHVFALDPVTQDQNVGSSFSRRRELQLVLALAAANKMITAQSLTRFVRRMEYDLETIELNRTAVGFSHGDQDFGWRFYPRVQAPAVPGNLTAITRDLLIGGQTRDSLQKDRMIEPGIRECTALVVMPSFVPYLTVDVRTNWFNLTANPLCLKPALKRTMDVSDAVELSEEITEMRQLSQQCVKDAHLYRDGVVHRLMKTVQQLESQLPLQTEYVQIPYENTSGGFEIFNSGITDLAPELIDWYGAPGIVVNEESLPTPQSSKTDITIDGENKKSTKIELPHPTDTTLPIAGTTIFLIGKNFTALGDGTRIIAGGADVSATKKLVSREVMQVTVPPGVATEEHSVHDSKGQYVDIHIATPYGVTRRLLVKVLDPSADSATAAITAAEKAEAAATKAEEQATKAQTVTTEAMEEHRSQKHFDKFHWSEDAIEMCYILNPNGTINDMRQQKPTFLEDESVVLDFGQDFAPSFEAKLGVVPWVKKDGDYVKSSQPFVLSKKVARHSHGKTLYALNEKPAELVRSILKETFQNLDLKDLPPNAKSIKYQLYLRMDAPPGEEGKVFRVENDLVVNFKDCTDGAAAPAPAPATAPAGAAATAPVPMERRQVEELPAPSEADPAEDPTTDEANALPVIDLLPPPLPAAKRDANKKSASRLASPVPLRSYLTAPAKVFQ